MIHLTYYVIVFDMVVIIVCGGVNWYNVLAEQFIHHGRLCQCTYNAATRTVASGCLCTHTHTSTQGTEPRARCRQCSVEERTSRNPCLRDIQSEGWKEGTQMCFVWCIHRLQKWSPIFKNEEISHRKCRFLISLRENEAGPGNPGPPSARGNTQRGWPLPPEATGVHTPHGSLPSHWSNQYNIRDNQEIVPL